MRVADSTPGGLRTVSFFGVLLALALSASGAEFARRGEFTVNLPEGWIEIPRAVLDARAKAIADTSPDSKTKDYEMGFQLGSAEGWFAYPYIMISVNNAGKIDEPDTGGFEKVPWKQDLEKQGEGKVPFVDKMTPGTPYYDSEHRIVWTRLDLTLTSAGRVTVLLGSVLTEMGLIQVDGYSKTENFPDFEDVFRAVAITLQPSAALVYRSAVVTIGEPRSPPPQYIGVIITALVACAIAGVLYLYRRQSKAEKQG